MRRELDHQLALEQRLAHEPQIELLQVAQAAVHELARAAGGSRGVVGSLDQRDAVAPRGGVERHPCTRDPAADDGDIEGLLRQSGERLSTSDHSPILANRSASFPRLRETPDSAPIR